MVLNRNRKIIFIISFINTILGVGVKLITTEPFFITYTIISIIYLLEVMLFFEETLVAKIAFGLMIPIHLIAGTFIITGLLSISLEQELCCIVHDPFLLFSVMILVSLFMSLFILIMSHLVDLKYYRILKSNDKRLKLFVIIEIMILAELLVHSMIFDTSLFHSPRIGLSIILSGISKVTFFHAGIFMVIGADLITDYKTKTQNKLLNDMYKKICFDKAECTMEIDCHTGRLLNHTISGQNQPDLIGTYYEMFIDNVIAHQVHSSDKDLVYEQSRLTYMIQSLQDSEGNYEYEYRKINHLGEYYWCSASIHVAQDEILDSIRAIVKVRNIQPEKDLRTKAEIDALSGLYNKKTTEACIAHKLETNQCGVLFIIDIDNFKAINDKLGHRMGDTVIADVSQKIKKVFRESDIVGRIGGDEFMVFINSNTSVIRRAEQLCNTILQTYTNNIVDVTISASIGIAYVRPDMTFTELYQLADAALYASKQKGKNTYTICDGHLCA